ncbi:MAG: ion transporter [Firmicutes bacterium]|jgi:voltage-gated potassium channel|nr:ion transporter [Bacillota bacterium]
MTNTPKTDKSQKLNRYRIFTIIQVGNLSDIPSRAYDFTLIGAILINIFIAIFDTFPQAEPYRFALWALEGITVLFFLGDYLLRIWTADYYYANIKGLTPARARRKFIFSWEGVIDLMSCLPFFISAGGAALRMFRIVRIIRVFRIHHYADPLRVIGDVLRKKRGQLLSSIFIVFTLMIAASLLMYNLEHKAQPDAFANAFSGFWWAANTLLTVGYGDVVPVTLAGKICGMVLTFLGVGMVAIPTGILSAGFVEQAELLRSKPASTPYHYCPHCGKPLPSMASATSELEASSQEENDSL